MMKSSSSSSSPLVMLIALGAIVLLSKSTITIGASAAAATSSQKTIQQQQQKRIKSIDYEKVKYKQHFPKRLGEEAAVVEWGHSAIISALDAVVAKFRPQPSMGASFEVEAAPVLADPMDGYTGLEQQQQQDGNDNEYTKILKNSHDIHGNVCVMTNSAGMSGVAMAAIAKNSGAVALMVVNVLEIDNPDFIYSLQCESDEECTWAQNNVDIPVIMISLSSGNVLTTVSSTTITTTTDTTNNDNTNEDDPQQQPHLSMPERVRLYAGGDRPFFEDVQHEEPVVYLIHNLLSAAECDTLIRKSSNLVEPLDDSKSNTLEGATSEAAAAFGVERAYLWSGMLKPHDQKDIDIRIEQVTGFPQNHISDFQVNKFTAGSYHGPHYDVLPLANGDGLGGGMSQQLASIYIFLTDASDDDDYGGEFVFPLAKKPIKIRPKKGMAVVFHNTYEDGQTDTMSAHGELALTSGTKWTACKWIYQHPVSKARRIVVPLFAYPFNGKAPTWIKELHNYLVRKFGPDVGSTYFDQLLLAIPVLLFLCIAALAAKLIATSRATTTVGDSKDAASSSNTKTNKKKQSKKSKNE